MARFPKPWSRERRGKTLWYVTLNGVQHPLGDDKAEAFREYHRMMQRRETGGEPANPASVQFALLAAQYLDNLRERRKRGTHTQQHFCLARAVKVLGKTLLASEVRRFHLSQIETMMRKARKTKIVTDPITKEKKTIQTAEPKYAPATIRDTLASVVGVMAWGVAQELIPANPLAGYRKPAAPGRTRLVTQDEFQSLMRAACRNRPLQRFMVAMRLTGCRPSELRMLRWEHVDFQREMFSLPVAEHKTGSQQKQPKPRVVPLSATVLKLFRINGRAKTLPNTDPQCPQSSQSKSFESPFVFLNEDGNPWTKDALGLAFRRCRERAGIQIKDGERLVLYSNRHTFGTTAAKKLGILSASKLLGHTTTRMTERYIHLDADDLKDIRRKLGT